MKIVNYNINDLIFSEYNPRQLNKEQHKSLTDSLKRFGIVDPIIINKHKLRNNIVIGGHARIRIAKELKIKTVPCVELDLTLKREKELNIRLNKNLGEFDFDLLANNFDIDDLLEWGFNDGELVGFDIEDNIYTSKIVAPTYEPSNEKPLVSELFNNQKTIELIREIEKLKLSDNEKGFLIKAANRHCVFNYSKIADYYAHSGKAVQELMENSALVIIDFDKAIENGFIKLSEDIIKLYKKEYPDE